MWWTCCLHELDSSTLCARWWNTFWVCNFITYKIILMVLSSQPEYTITLIIIQCSVVLQRPSNCESGNWNTNTADPCEEYHSSVLSYLQKAVVRLLWCVILLYDAGICFMTIPLWHTVVTVMGFHRWCILMTWVQTIMQLTKQWTNNAEMKVQVRYIMLEEDTFS